MISNARPSTRFLLVLMILFSVALSLAYDYVIKVDRPTVEVRRELQMQILNGEAPSPYQYRVLVPFLTRGMEMVIGLVFPSLAFLLAYALYDLLAIFFSLVCLYIFIRRWFTLEQSLIGVLAVAAFMPISFQYHYFQPWSLLEIGTFTLALLAIRDQKWLLLALTVLVASLNRETAVFIPLAFFLVIIPFQHFDLSWFRSHRREIAFGLLLGLIWLVIFAGLRLIFGSSPHIADIGEQLRASVTMANLRRAIVALTLFLGAFWLFALLGFRRAPAFVRKTVRVVPFYMALFLIFTNWYETRMIMPLYAVLIPLALSYLFEPHEQQNARPVLSAISEDV